MCYFSLHERVCPAGLKQEAFITSRQPHRQRQFCVANPSGLSSEAAGFWEEGFWEKSAKQKALDSCALTGHGACSFNLRCFPVDHSIPGACAWGIETGSGWVIYSGDLRLHGKRSNLTKKFIEEAAALHPRALIIEGTNIQRPANISEEEVFDNGLKAIKNAGHLVIADFSARDVDRLLTFYQIARETDRKLAILPRDAYLLKTMRLLEPAIPDIAKEENLVIYQDTTASRSPALWMRNLYQEYAGKVVLAADVKSAQDKFILSFSFFDLNELPSISPAPGSLYVFSSSEPHDEEQEIDFRRLHNWLDVFKLKSIGLPVETSIGNFVIPDTERGLHASGHACGIDLFEIARTINPEILIPVHSEHPEVYNELKTSHTDVILPVAGNVIEV